MARINGSSSSLNYLLELLEENGIREFSTLESILDFRKTWKDSIIQHQEQQKEKLQVEINQIKSDFNLLSTQYKLMIIDRTKLLNEEKVQLPSQIVYYSSSTKNPFKFLFYKLKRNQSSKRLDRLTHNFNDELVKPFRHLSDKVKNLERDAAYHEANFDHLVSSRSQTYIDRINFINRILDEKNTLISGAIGEQQVTKELGKLPAAFTIFNDLQMSFNPPIYNKNENDRILSIQVDHLVIGPSGVFLLETKNWSEKSLQNLNLFSPVKQIRRANFALFTLLNSSVSSGSLRLSSHHWGKKKIAIRSVLLMTNAKPKEQFQFVKVLSIKEIVNYISYFEETFSSKEVETIANFVMR